MKEVFWMTKGIYDAKYHLLMAFVQYGVDMAMKGEVKDIWEEWI